MGYYKYSKTYKCKGATNYSNNGGSSWATLGIVET